MAGLNAIIPDVQMNILQGGRLYKQIVQATLSWKEIIQYIQARLGSDKINNTTVVHGFGFRLTYDYACMGYLTKNSRQYP